MSDEKRVIHGDLIDRDDFIQYRLRFDAVMSGYNDFYVPYSQLVQRLKDAPAVIVSNDLPDEEAAQRHEHDRQYLVDLIIEAVNGCSSYWAGLIADHLLENGIMMPGTADDLREKEYIKGTI